MVFGSTYDDAIVLSRKYVLYRGEQPKEDSSIGQPSSVLSSHVRKAHKRALVWVEMRAASSDQSSASYTFYLQLHAISSLYITIDYIHSLDRTIASS
jgi:hypothetical protein